MESIRWTKENTEQEERKRKCISGKNKEGHTLKGTKEKMHKFQK